MSHLGCDTPRQIISVSCATDYQVATSGMAALAAQAAIYKDERFSDHAPLIIDYMV